MGPPAESTTTHKQSIHMRSILGQIEFSAISQKTVKPATIKGIGRIKKFERFPTIMGHFF